MVKNLVGLLATNNSLAYFDVPRLEPDAKQVVGWVPDIHIPKSGDAFVFISLGKFAGEVACAQANLANVKITNSVVGMPRWRKRS